MIKIENTQKIELTFVFLIVLFVYYQWSIYITREIEYFGLALKFHVIKLMATAFILAFTALFTVVIRDGKARYLMWFFYIFYCAPNSATYTFYDADVSIIISQIVSYLIALLILINFNRPQITTNLVKPYNRIINTGEAKVIWAVAVLYFLILMYFFFKHGWNININAILLENIYESRFEVSAGRSWAENLLFSSQTKVIGLLLISYTTFFKKYRLLIIVFACQWYLFSTSAQKSIIISSLMVFSISYIIAKAKNHTFNGVINFKSCLILLASLLAITFISNPAIDLIQNIFIRRLLFVPSYLNVVYFDFFYDEPLLLSHSILNGVFKVYSYDSMPAFRVGEYAWGFFVSLNNGVLSDGYMNFGILGAITFMTFTMIVVLFISRLVPIYLYPVIFAYAWQFLNSALIVSFITHGFCLFIIIGLVISFNSKKQNNDN